MTLNSWSSTSGSQMLGLQMCATRSSGHQHFLMKTVTCFSPQAELTIFAGPDYLLERNWKGTLVVHAYNLNTLRPRQEDSKSKVGLGCMVSSIFFFLTFFRALLGGEGWERERELNFFFPIFSLWGRREVRTIFKQKPALKFQIFSAPRCSALSQVLRDIQTLELRDSDLRIFLIKKIVKIGHRAQTYNPSSVLKDREAGSREVRAQEQRRLQSPWWVQLGF